MSQLVHYFVTDIEADGPDPALNSMLAFTSVVVREDGEMCGEFEAVIEPRPGRAANAETMAWWATQPEAWRAATEGAEPPSVVMTRFAQWVGGFPEKRSFAARPLAFDGGWMDCYLRAYANAHVLDVPHWGRKLFTRGAMDIGTYAAGVFGRTTPDEVSFRFPPEWLGHHPHTHRAIDDARGYASLLSKLFAVARKLPSHPDDFLGART